MSSISSAHTIDEEGFTPVLSRSQRQKLAKQNKPPAPVAEPIARQKSAQWIASKPVASVANVAPIHQGCILMDGFRKLSREERGKLLHGPKIAILVKGTKVCNISKRLLMAVSALAHRDLTVHQTEPILSLPDHLDKDAVASVLGYFKNVCSVNYYNLGHPDDIEVTGGIYQAARTLETGGAELSVLGYLKYKIFANKLGYIDMHALLNCCDGVHDPLFEVIAKNMAQLRYTEAVGKPGKFESFLRAHPQLSAAMDDIDAEHDAKRKQTEAAKTARLKDEQRNNKASTQQVANNMSHPGLRSMTQEQARSVGLQ
ncbi:hypothetical protein BDV96DRAFT_600359 [Lophiotrema nucula]|uniref:Uncharacterized protein n=1 Tax=Lophiotrema nucula TaxID=690887 RepID=A0A6A5Z4G0_9PLEO|nr:hypothetical protein BDV96DRAFT_600359 [Lophiotrema nucula]